MSGAASWREKLWARRGAAAALLPLAAVYTLAGAARRRWHLLGKAGAPPLSAPVVVVGNITAGGGGKTPAVIALARALQQRGIKTGIIARGDGGQTAPPREVRAEDAADVAGDEALLIKQKTGAPVWTGKDRAAAARQLLAAHQCDIVISDDGMQHARLPRAVELAAASISFNEFGEGENAKLESFFGNGWPLPAGPLREPPRRLKKCDAILAVGFDSPPRALLELNPQVFAAPLRARHFYFLHNPKETLPPTRFQQGKNIAAAGIARPQRFFNTLAQLQIPLAGVAPFADHHRFTQKDFAAMNADHILLTEKDAVKCAAFKDARMAALAVEAELPDAAVEAVLKKAEAGMR